MDYELCKKLKEKGYPIKEHFITEGENYIKPGNYVAPEVAKDSLSGWIKVGASYFEIPDLSELIEACGECLSHIKRLPVDGIDYWWAVSHCGHLNHEVAGNNLEEQGSTPQEAVARLWLAINSK